MDSPEFAALLDARDPLARQIPLSSTHLPRFRERFEFPTLGSLPCQTEGPPNSPVIYMCGNSLGLKPKQADEYMREQLGANLTPDDDQPPLLLRQLGPESCLHAFHRQDPGSAGGESSVTTFNPVLFCFQLLLGPGSTWKDGDSISGWGKLAQRGSSWFQQ